MKINIKKLQGGGAALFDIYTPTATGSQTASSYSGASSYDTSSSKTSSDDSITDKDLLKMLGLVDGLPSDMNAIMSSISKLYSNPFSGDSINTSNLNTRYIATLNAIKTAKFNKAQFDEAKKQVQANGGLNEVAIDSDGRIVVATEKGLDRISIETYLKDGGKKYRALSNLELLNYRAYNKPNDTTIFNVVNNGVGMDAVNKYILNIIANLGDTNNTIEGYTLKKSSNNLTILLGFGLLQELANSGLDLTGGLDGVFRSKMITSELKSKALKALNYLYTTMPDNMKTLLLFHAGSKEAALKIVEDLVLGKTKDTKEYSTTLVLDANGNKPGGKSSSSKSSGTANGDSAIAGLEDLKTNLYSDIITGTGGSNSSYQIKDKDGNVMSVNGLAYPLLSLGSNKITNGSISDFMLNFNSIYRGNKYAITFGSLVLDKTAMDNMTFQNDGSAIRTYLPVKDDGQGHIVPDLLFMETHKDIVDLINSKDGSMLDPEVLKKLKDAGLINEFTGEVDSNRFAPYLLVNGLGTNRNIKDTSFVNEVTGDNLDQMIDQFENDLYIKKGAEGDDQGKEHRFNFDRQNLLNPLDWFGNYDKLYQGTIFIPITLNVNQGLQGGGTELKMSELDIMELKYNNFNIQSSMNNTSSNLLGI